MELNHPSRETMELYTMIQFVGKVKCLLWLYKSILARQALLQL